MKKQIRVRCAGLLGLLMLAGTAQATLIDRGNGMLYDTVLDITWLQDANYAKTSGYDSDGLMTWEEAVAWADNLVYGGYDDWRLPTIVAPDSVPFRFANNGSNAGGYGATGAGYGTDTPAGGWGTPADGDGIWSELGWMWYHNLGNLGKCLPDDTDPTGCVTQAGWGLNSTTTPDGLVSVNNLQSYVYWSGTEYARYPIYAWTFRPGDGYQGLYLKENYRFYAWAVRSGDVLAVPEPSALLLTALGLAALGILTRKGNTMRH